MKTKALIAMIFVGAGWASMAAAKHVPRDVLLCHNGKDVVVSAGAVQAHVAHGDCIGPCERGCLEPYPFLGEPTND